jgi:hypothetical protein
VLRRTLALLFFATALHAQSPAPGLVLTPPVLVSEPHLGSATAGDRVLGVAPQGDGFRVWYSRETDGGAIHVVDIAANGQADLATHRVVFATSAAVRAFTASSAAGRTFFLWRTADEVHFSPATADGLPEVPAGVVVTHGDARGFACNTERCLFTIDGGPAGAVATLLSLSGEMLRQVPIPRIGIAATDDHGFLLTGVADGLHALRIDNAGMVTFDTIVQQGKMQASSSADFDGQQYALVWSNQGDDRSTYIAHVTLAGAVEPPRRLRDDAPFSSGGNLVWNGREHVYAYAVSGFVPVIPEILAETTPYLQLLDHELVPIGVPRELQHSPGGTIFHFEAAVNRGTTYLAWEEGFGFFAALTTIHGALAGADRSVTRAGGLYLEPLPQSPQAIAATADTTVAVWSDADLNALDPLDSIDSSLWFTRFTRSGVRLDAQSHLITEFAEGGRVVASAMASDVLVAWHRGRQTPQPMQATILHTADGTAEQYALPMTDFGGGLAAATNGSSWLIVAGRSLVAISRTGVLLTPTAVRYTAQAPSSVSIASDGNRYLLTWKNSTPQSDAGPVSFAIVNGDGSIAVPEQTAHPLASSVSATFTGRDYLLASSDGRTSTLVSRVSPAGALLSTSTVSLAGAVTLAPLGTGALLTSRRGTPVLGVRLTAEGTAVDAQPFALPFVPNVTAPTPQRTIVNLRTITTPGAAARAAVQELLWNQNGMRRGVAHP